MRELIIYSDESAKKGPYFSNFYGGVLVRSSDLGAATSRLQARRVELGLENEIKWGKVTSHYLPSYRGLMETFFDLVAADTLKVRIMFTKNSYRPTALEEHHRANRYHLLYYQFIKHAFGLRYAGKGMHAPTRVRVYPDQMPHTREKNAQFKAYVSALQRSPPFRHAGISIPVEQVAEVNSKDHILLQGLDVVLGAMQFRLNDLHKIKPPGSRRRGKRTIAKERLYKEILRRIRAIRPGFNIGVSTGKDGDRSNFWLHSYRHWLFIPAGVDIDVQRNKPRNR